MKKIFESDYILLDFSFDRESASGYITCSTKDNRVVVYEFNIEDVTEEEYNALMNIMEAMLQRSRFIED